MGDETKPEEWRQYTHSQAVARMKDIFDELERLQAKGERSPLDDKDAERFAELTAEFKTVRDHKDALERKAATEVLRKDRERLQTATFDALRRPGRTESGGGPTLGEFDRDAILEPDSIEDCRFRNPWDLSEIRTFSRSPDEVAAELRARALSAIEKMPASNDGVRAAATQIIEEHDNKEGRLSRLCLTTSSPGYMRAWSKVITGRESALSAEERMLIDRAMSLSDTSGGYMVPFQLDPTVIITGAGSRNDIRKVARVVVAIGDEWHGVTAAEGAWSWDGEGEQVSDDSPTMGQPTIPNYQGDGFVPASIRSLQDMANATTEIARILARGKDTLEATAFATGSGTGQPTGIITALTGTAYIQTSTTTDTFAVADIYKVDGALPESRQANAAWLGNRKVYNLVSQFDTGGGASLWKRLGEGLPPELNGQPAYRAEAMDGAINAGSENYMLVYGDFEAYVITDRIGFSIEPIPHLFGSSGRPTGSRGIYAYYRTGADSVDDASFQMLNVT